MKLYYCANCGTRINVAIKAVKNYGIIRIVEYHECSDEPIEFDLEPVEHPTYILEKDSKHNKFVQKLNNLPNQKLAEVMDQGGDRRPNDQVKSSAPATILDQIKHTHNSIPAGDISKEPPE